VVLDERNTDLARAAVWATIGVQEPWVVPLLHRLAVRAIGSSALDGWLAGDKVPNACIVSLGQIGSAKAVAALQQLQVGTKHNGLRKRIAAALAMAAAASGLTPGQDSGPGQGGSPARAGHPLVFSEAMRDLDLFVGVASIALDLFVGVASIALDPNWADRGTDPYYEYWRQASFSPLSATAGEPDAARRRHARSRLLTACRPGAAAHRLSRRGAVR
jgi:hypothetical protein